jgi:hypothetical protein
MSWLSNLIHVVNGFRCYFQQLPSPKRIINLIDPFNTRFFSFSFVFFYLKFSWLFCFSLLLFSPRHCDAGWWVEREPSHSATAELGSPFLFFFLLKLLSCKHLLPSSFFFRSEIFIDWLSLRNSSSSGSRAVNSQEPGEGKWSNLGGLLDRNTPRGEMYGAFCVSKTKTF